MKPLQGDTQFYASFTDLLALLLVFFIYLTAMNSVASLGQVDIDAKLIPADYAPVDVAIDSKEIHALVLKVQSHVLFPIGSAQINQGGQSVLNELAEVVIRMPVRLVISGHTDSVPISRPIIESNWHLSALRAASVANYLQEQGVPESYLKVVGFSKTVPEHLSDNSLNRRVEIRLEQL